jgi:hypothetical protein
LRNEVRWLIYGVAVLIVFSILANSTSPGDGSKRDGSKHHTANNASNKQIIERGKAAREREQNPKPGHAPLPKGDTLEVYYKTTGGADLCRARLEG